MSDFVHLHNHSHYSLLDAIATIKQNPKKAKPDKMEDNFPGLIDKALADGHTAIALTDHGVMFGAIEFYKAAKDSSIKPIIGMEGYITNTHRGDRQPMIYGNMKRNYFHILFHAKNNIGYKNLMKLTSIAHEEGMYYKPRIDKETLVKHAEGLICTSACIGSMINAHLINGDYEMALNEARWYKDLFGDDFYIELQNHGLEEDAIILDQAPKIAKAIGAKLIATNDIHYIEKEDNIAHNIHLAIQNANSGNSGTFNINELRYKVPEFYFKTQAEMKELFKDFPDAIENTLEIAEKCELEIELGKLNMPEFEIPSYSTAKNLDEYLKEETYKGLEFRFGKDLESIEGVKKRADYELQIIAQMKFPGYFLIVWDFIKAAKERGVRVGPGRGSAAGSLVAFALGITNVDPLKYDLLFERFLNPERVSMPDIDIDFQDDKRDIVIDYCIEKYGKEAIAQIITYGKLSSKAVLTDVGRVLGVPLAKIKEMTKSIPVKFGKVKPLGLALKELEDFKKYKDDKDEKMQLLLEHSFKLENKFRHTGIHAAGVVIAPGDIRNYVPVYSSGKSKDHTIEVVTQYSMNELEDAGLLKMDFLGLKTLSIIDDTLQMVKNNHGIVIDIDAIDLNDDKTFDLISSGHTLSIFQFESGGMQDYLKKLKPRDMEEIAAMNALYRPGPMANIPDYIDRKFGRKPIEYLHPIMKEVLEKTNGIIVYQEQVMKLVQVIAGFTLGQADVLRRAMGKKKIDIMESMKGDFIKGAAKNKISEDLAIKIFDLIYEFANYGFNKSHSIAYSFVAYQTAWLKAHYTAEFLAANMTAEIDDQTKLVELIDEAKYFGIEVLPPDVNRSEAKFKAVDNKIYFGMAGIRNVGISAVDSIVESRKEKPFVSFFDFVTRIDTRLINKRALEALICAGAFDSLQSGTRAKLFASVEPALVYAKAYKENNNSDMDSLFGGEVQSDLKEPDLVDAEEWTDKERLAYEKEVLNFWVSGHPLKEFEIELESLIQIKLGSTEYNETDEPVRIAGIVNDVRMRRDKKERPIAFLMMEDFAGKSEVIMWAETYEKYGHMIEKGKILVITGTISPNEENLKIVANEVMTIKEAMDKFVSGYKFWIDLEKDTPELIKKLKNIIFDELEPQKRIEFNVTNNGNGDKNKYVSLNFHAKTDGNSLNKIIELIGESRVRYITN